MHSNIPGIDIQLQGYCREIYHFHPEIELLYVVSGTVSVKVQETEYQMMKNDILLINSSIQHAVQSDDKTVFCRIQISYTVLAQVIQDGNYVFYCNSAENMNMPYQELQRLMKKIVITFTGKARKSECLRQGLVYELMDNLIEYFQVDNKNTMRQKKHSSEQLQYIINYVNMNFEGPIHVQNIADALYISASTVSRLFRKQTGLYFTDFVCQVRLNHAVRDLRETNKTITKIAMDNGFSTASVFSKLFQKEYQCSPTEFRRNYQSEKKEEQNQEQWSVIERTIETLKLETKENTRERTNTEIYIPCGKGQEYQKFWGRMINAGSAYNLTMANLQYHILYLTEHLKFSYVRIWNLFSTKMMIQRNENDHNYNFDIIDNILDFMSNHGIKPCIDFGRRPETALAGEGNPIYYVEECINFNTRRDWETMFSAFMNHLIRRYGKEETEQWIYEFSVDPRYQDSSYTNIIFCFQRIREYLPNAQIGGFGAVVDNNMDELFHWLDICTQHNCEPDYVSVLGFPYVSVVENGHFMAKRSANQNYINDQIVNLKKQFEKKGYGRCKLYITEWNISLSNRNYLNDSCFRAANLIQTVERLWNVPDLLCLWMGSDWISSYYDTSGVANGGSGILTKAGIRKPVYYALSFLNGLGNEFLQKGNHYIATNGGTSFYILCHNCKEYSPEYFIKEEDELDLDHLQELFDNNDALDFNIELSQLQEDETYIVKKRIVDFEHGSVIDQWKKFQYEKDMEGNDMKYLREICIPYVMMEKIKVKGGALPIHMTLEPQAFALIHVYKSTN